MPTITTTTPLSEDDIEKLFSGAPQYFARSEGHYAGPPHASVAYPWDESLEIRDLADHAPVLDEAWSCATAWPHLTRDRKARERRETRRARREERRRARRERERREEDGEKLEASAEGEKVTTTTLTASGVATPIAAGSRSPCRAGSKRAHFYPRCREKPSMLSMQGLEKGTAGFQAALELGVADALLPQQDPDSDFEDEFREEQRESRKTTVDKARLSLLSAKDGLRRLDEETVLQGLTRNESRYLDGVGIRGAFSSKHLYDELFTSMLHPPTRVLDRADPHGLSSQIRALLKVLATPDAWVDYSHVQKRLRLGKVLWADLQDHRGDMHDQDEAAKEKAERAEKQRKRRHEERYWLLLQLLLACELLVRLDAITEGEELGIESIRPSEVLRFERDCTASVRWSLILARVWLENIEVTKVDAAQPTDEKDGHSTSTGWLSIITKRMTLTGESGFFHHHKQGNHPLFAMKGKFGERQVNGLAHFARELRWPDAENYIGRITTACRTLTERMPMPIPPGPPPLLSSGHESHLLCSPTSPTSAASSSSGWHWPSHHRANSSPKRPTPSLAPQNPNRKLVLPLHPAGWLSRSYLSGLVMPGEALSHVLMATLLESDIATSTDNSGTVRKLANLRGGLVHKGKSFWSTCCVVGRVLAAGRGSAECMGWISSYVIPRGWTNPHLGDQDDRALKWVDVETAKALDGSEDELLHAIGTTSSGFTRRNSHDCYGSSYEKKARLWAKAAIERESSVLGDADPAMILPADFIIPFETAYADPAPRGHVGVEMTGLELVEDNSEGEKKGDDDIKSYAATVSFVVTEDDSYDGEGDYEDRTTTVHKFLLCHDVHFVTAHPCVPSRHVKIFQSPSSPTIQQIDVGGVDASISSISSGGMGTGMGGTVYITGHPLHKYYTYTAIHLTHLLSRPNLTLDQHLSGAHAAKESEKGPSKSDDTPNRSSGLPHSKHHHKHHHHTHHHHPSTALKMPRLLVVDCITAFQPQLPSHEVPLSPIASRDPSNHDLSIPAGARPSSAAHPPLSRSVSSFSTTPPSSLGDHPALWPQDQHNGASGANIRISTDHRNDVPPRARTISSMTLESEEEEGEEVCSRRMHHETRRRRFGSDMEVLARALCAEKGWNAVVSRRRRGCLACAMREAGALGWKVVLRVD